MRGLGKASWMILIALVLLTTRLSWGAGTETESDAMPMLPAVETDCDFPEEDTCTGEDPEREKAAIRSQK